eukprot:15344381-Ditylum_brightwellii.AAC.1
MCEYPICGFKSSGAGLFPQLQTPQYVAVHDDTLPSSSHYGHHSRKRDWRQREDDDDIHHFMSQQL